ncbi:hypothetical protein [Actinomadura parmotrematis]|uniref:Uncharacterized protein n=1 Tax=Actinomadura parmotrematis TaxID=2864039 RepID=A0ABS7FX20_9ACTN|nr:hypothetical protein [Actinomadura parmotrematis]MBW8484861.1 hypothetical protein [Actinomadura parmotrematis]
MGLGPALALIAVAYALGLLTGRLRRRAPAPPAVPAGPDETDRAITGFGEELAALDIDPAAPRVHAESLADYGRALDAYEEAKQARTADPGDPVPTRRALEAGRTALIRIQAREAGRPVPADPERIAAHRPAPAYSGDRFRYQGRSDADHLFAIDWPEPGAPAIVHFARQGADGEARLEAVAIADGREEAGRVAFLWGPAEGRFLIGGWTNPVYPAGATHLRVPADDWPSAAHNTWTLRLESARDAAELTAEHHGLGADVLAVRAAARTALNVHLDTDGPWRVAYQCGRAHAHRPACRRGEPALAGSGPRMFGLTLPGPGLVCVDVPPRARWSLTLAEAGPAGAGRLLRGIVPGGAAP